MNNYSTATKYIQLHDFQHETPIVMGIPVRFENNLNPIQSNNQCIEHNSIASLDNSSQRTFNEPYVQNPFGLNLIPGEKSITIQSSEDQLKEQEYIIHDVKQTDTLLGLSIQYGVSEFRIRQANDLESNEIYFKKQLRIPNPKSNMESNLEINQEQAHQDQLIFFFMSKILQGKDKTNKMAKIYLEAADWDLQQAQADYLEDLDVPNPKALYKNVPSLIKKII